MKHAKGKSVSPSVEPDAMLKFIDIDAERNDIFESWLASQNTQATRVARVRFDPLFLEDTYSKYVVMLKDLQTNGDHTKFFRG